MDNIVGTLVPRDFHWRLKCFGPGLTLGIKDETVPSNQGEVWNNTHTATLEDYKINERTESLYTPEAIKASEEQDMREEL
ncbi:hypothetical protein H0259_08685 [Pectobacterium aroidearum]|nr:hypothetical protein [Pectobacterium aroidearum]